MEACKVFVRKSADKEPTADGTDMADIRGKLFLYTGEKRKDIGNIIQFRAYYRLGRFMVCVC